MFLDFKNLRAGPGASAVCLVIPIEADEAELPFICNPFDSPPGNALS